MLNSLRRHLLPLLDAAAAEQAAAAGAGHGPVGSGGAASGPATTPVLQLLEGENPLSSVPTPWELGLAVPLQLVPLLWPRYCTFLVARATDVEKIVARGGSSSLAAELAAAAAAAPSSAHALLLAARLLLHGCPKCCSYNELEDMVQLSKKAGQRLRYVQALRQAGDELAPCSTVSPAEAASPAASSVQPAERALALLMLQGGSCWQPPWQPSVGCLPKGTRAWGCQQSRLRCWQGCGNDCREAVPAASSACC